MLRQILKLPLFIMGVFLVVVLLPANKALAGQSKEEVQPPPVAPVKPVTTDYYGTKVVDPYRYMENLKDPKVQTWMKAQNDYTRAVLAQIPGREKLLERIRQLDQTVPQVQATRLPGNRYLVLKSLPGESTAKLYSRQGVDGNDKLLADPGKIELALEDRGKGKSVIGYFAISPDGKYVAVGITPGGAQNDTELHVIETSSGRDTGDVILRASMGSITAQAFPLWLPDSRSFVYEKLPELSPDTPVTELYQKGRAYLHTLGHDPAKDPAVFGYDVVPTIHIGPQYMVSVEAPPGSAYAVGMINDGSSRNSAFYLEPAADLGKTHAEWRKVADFSDDIGAAVSVTSDSLATAIAVHGNDLYLLSFKNSPRSKVVRTDVRNPDLAAAETVVPPGQAVVTGIHPAKDALYVELMDGGINRLLRVPYGLKPKVEEVPLPFKGALDVETDPRVSGALLGMETWTKAYRIYAYDPKTDRVTNIGLQPTGPYDNPSNIESQEVKAPSYDGTLVPLSVVYPKDMKLDGSNPTILYGYGAYGITRLPTFGRTWLALYENGVVLAVCHVRGGGAYGEQWRLAGKGPTKANTWRDFIACAQYLIRHKYTASAHLAGMGVSAGGITIGRAITTRPDLFAAAIDWVGVADMLRFETTANGPSNIPEFGSVKTQSGFKALYAMSPYAHVKKGTPYPAVLLMTGTNDPYVAPWQMDKMAARLQAATSSGKPVLLRVDYAGGHSGFGATKTQGEELDADIFSFSLWQLGARNFQPTK
jgi:prolyl oligopeptidase